MESPSEIPAAIEAGAEGVGLFRTEFLVRSGAPLPSEADHLRAYREALSLLDGRPLVIRTYDLGADKLNPDHAAEKEPNPFLGRRSLRLCLERMDIFVPQVRAILRAAAFEICFLDKVPTRVALSEYVDVADAFFDRGDEPRFINGVLNTLARSRRPNEYAP